jgi:hypothetical protein
MYAATSADTRADGHRPVTSSSPVVATTSPSHCPAPARTLLDNCNTGRSNIAFARAAPVILLGYVEPHGPCVKSDAHPATQRTWMTFQFPERDARFKTLKWLGQ